MDAETLIKHIIILIFYTGALAWLICSYKCCKYCYDKYVIHTVNTDNDLVS